MRHYFPQNTFPLSKFSFIFVYFMYLCIFLKMYYVFLFDLFLFIFYTLIIAISRVYPKRSRRNCALNILEFRRCPRVDGQFVIKFIDLSGNMLTPLTLTFSHLIYWLKVNTTFFVLFFVIFLEVWTARHFFWITSQTVNNWKFLENIFFCRLSSRIWA